MEWEKERTDTILFKMLLFAMAGVSLGAILANIARPERGVGTELFRFYLSDRLQKPDVLAKNQIILLLIHRSRIFLFYGIMGFTPLRKHVVLAGSAGIGFLTGSAISMSLLDYGFWGLAVLAGANFPQALFFSASLLILMVKIYQGNIGWKSCLYSFSCWILGILAEIWINPPVLSWIFEKT